MAFKLKDGSGVEHTYDQKKLKIPGTTEGETVVFTEGEVQTEKTVDISANGAFEVEPDEGFAFVKKVSGNIAVPAPVTSVNGQTGDVKTGMVVNFTVTDGGELSPDTPFADVLTFIQASPNYLPDITANTISVNNEFENYTFAQYQLISSADGESRIIFFGGKNIMNALVGLSCMLVWSSNKVTCFNYSAPAPVVLYCEKVTDKDWSVSPVAPTDDSAFAVFDGGLAEMMSMGISIGNYPAMLVVDGSDMYPAYFLGLSGASMVFKTPELNGVIKVITGTSGESGISWTVTEERSSVFIVDFDQTNLTANKTFAEIHEAATNGIPVFLHEENRLLPLSINNGVSTSSITFESVFIDKTGYISFAVTVTSNNEWSIAPVAQEFQYKSPGGKFFKLGVSDDGVLSTKEVKS